MAIKAVVFDIGGVLEYTPKLGIAKKWKHSSACQKAKSTGAYHIYGAAAASAK